MDAVGQKCCREKQGRCAPGLICGTSPDVGAHAHTHRAVARSVGSLLSRALRIAHTRDDSGKKRLRGEGRERCGDRTGEARRRNEIARDPETKLGRRSRRPRQREKQCEANEWREHRRGRRSAQQVIGELHALTHQSISADLRHGKVCARVHGSGDAHKSCGKLAGPEPASPISWRSRRLSSHPRVDCALPAALACFLRISVNVSPAWGRLCMVNPKLELPIFLIPTTLEPAIGGTELKNECQGTKSFFRRLLILFCAS
ncbi:hypothetical protein HPB48_003602 [Haemaphysalis longicornis]|uniref:Uncharacterized protein n=1 Tax=Haemaphysalis longicornis TaxID=44386 RepID=A0A9J6FDE1_HAELO|nr:hypothetical protein HPB48_003602 [Haemaphysalis longicornis]